MKFDVVIVGAGPAGLCLARALSGQGLQIALVEQNARESLEKPTFDGREIALTQYSAQTLRDLGLWAYLPERDIAPLRDAKIFDGTSPHPLRIGHELSTYSELGWLVSNHLIRQAAWQGLQDSVEHHADITLLAPAKVVSVQTSAHDACATLSDGRTLHARLLVAADSRFSATRRMLGIGAHMHDFGKNMVVACVSHEKPHDFAAWEWFDYGQTLALLPMNPDPDTGLHRSSVVITVPSVQAQALMDMPEDEFNAQVTQRYHQRLGAMQLLSTRHNYPLVGVYPHRTVSKRFATIGDAAVGMHPVTAHGFNFGLLGVKTLSRAVIAAQHAGTDIASEDLLARYEREHRWATQPLYLTTRLIVALYTHESTAAKVLRKVGLGVGDKLTPFKRSIARYLATAG